MFTFERKENDCEVWSFGYDWVAWLYDDNTLVISGKGEDDYKKIQCESREKALSLLQERPVYILFNGKGI